MEKLKKSAAERMRSQEKFWMKLAMHDACAFQIQRVWFEYLRKKDEFQEDFEVKFGAASALQKIIRIRLARKRVKERRSRYGGGGGGGVGGEGCKLTHTPPG
jgi:hypothetical protein